MEKGSPTTGALTTGDLDKIAGLLDDRLAPLATKEFVKDEISGLKTYMNEGFETVMDGLDSLEKSFANKERVEKLIRWAKVVSEKVDVKFDA